MFFLCLKFKTRLHFFSIYSWLIGGEYKFYVCFIIIVEHVHEEYEELCWLKRDVIGFEIEWRMSFFQTLSGWLAGQPVYQLRVMRPCFCFILFITSPLHFYYDWHLIWLYYIHFNGRYAMLSNDKKKKKVLKVVEGI